MGSRARPKLRKWPKYHIHIHVSVYVNGQMMRLPGGVGITKPPLIEKYKAGNFYDVVLYDCLYWIHTHVADGIIHVEAPVKQSFTLGQFFAVWAQPLSANLVGPASGQVAVFENGKRLTGDPLNRAGFLGESPDYPARFRRETVNGSVRTSRSALQRWTVQL
ncbi:MAG: hypothetical protein B7X07_06050 [Actinobacteria bacterium 21-64-8]|nr:MAG: hypothetical protein B7X07_06050 [Actinobacteria bacterium 21-64-8]